MAEATRTATIVHRRIRRWRNRSKKENREKLYVCVCGSGQCVRVRSGETVVRWFAWNPCWLANFGCGCKFERRDWYDEYSTYRAYGFADEDETEDGS